jgi:hypothetical protein
LSCYLGQCHPDFNPYRLEKTMPLRGGTDKNPFETS